MAIFVSTASGSGEVQPKSCLRSPPVKLAIFVEETVFLNEEDEILVNSLVKMFLSSGQSRRFWERNIEWSRIEGIHFPEYALQAINVALDIAFRNEATA